MLQPDIIQTLDKIRAIHKDFTFYHEPGGSLVGLTDEQLSYIISLLSDKVVSPSYLPAEQWDRLISTLSAHWLMSLFYVKISSLPPALWPPQEAIAALKARYLLSTKHSVMIQKQLKEISKAFSEENIRFLVLKGAALSLQAYPDPAMRPCADIDLLVFPEDVIKSRKILESLSYTCNTKYYDISPNYFCEEEFSPSPDLKNYSLVEIHWHLESYYLNRKMGLKEIFNRAIMVRAPGLTFEAMDPVDAIVYVSKHMILKHNKELKLYWIYDISLLCSRLTDDDWDTLGKRCHQFGACIPMQHVLRMAQCWTGLKLPDKDISLWLKPDKEEADAFDYAIDKKDSLLNKLRLEWPANAPFMEKSHLLLYFIFPPKHVLTTYYPPPRDWLWPLSYIVRWSRLLRRALLP